jgi:PhzF family phenazine biosynthesis protein
LEFWLDDELMQKIANENNLSETAFFVKENESFRIRWFTPTDEVDLCGHATLSSSYIIFDKLDYGKDEISFISKSGNLSVDRTGDLINLNFPSRNPIPIEPDKKLLDALKLEPVEVLFDKTTVCVFETEDQIKNLNPDVQKFLDVDTHGVIVTSQGISSDFVSRFFAPDVGINEDPVTGYAHTLLIPYWAAKLNKNKLHAFQLSKRGGEIFCENLDGRVLISGRASIYLEGKIYI